MRHLISWGMLIAIERAKISFAILGSVAAIWCSILRLDISSTGSTPHWPSWKSSPAGQLLLTTARRWIYQNIRVDSFSYFLAELLYVMVGSRLHQQLTIVHRVFLKSCFFFLVLRYENPVTKPITKLSFAWQRAHSNCSDRQEKPNDDAIISRGKKNDIDRIS
jgi:hypothetical protein